MDDLPQIAEINSICFSGNGNHHDAEKWMRTRFNNEAFRIWVAEISAEIAGYIAWEIKGGFNRKEPVTELEQMAVATSHRRQGVGYNLIAQSILSVGQWIRETNKVCGNTGTIIVWALADNNGANELYRRFFKQTAGFQLRYSRSENALIGTINIPK